MTNFSSSWLSQELGNWIYLRRASLITRFVVIRPKQGLELVLSIFISNCVFGLICLNNVGSEKNALQALKASDWHLEAAFDVFYSQPQPRSNAAEVRRLEELYNRYKGKLLVVTLLS